MRLHVANFLCEGLTKEYKLGDLVLGYTTNLSAKINTGTLERGNLYIDDVVTPILDWWKGPASGHNFTMLTGKDELDRVGSIYNMDGLNEPYVWLKNSLWTS